MRKDRLMLLLLAPRKRWMLEKIYGSRITIPLRMRAHHHHARWVCRKISSQMLRFQWSCEESLASFDSIMILLKLLDSHWMHTHEELNWWAHSLWDRGPPDSPDYINDDAQAIWRRSNIIVVSISSVSLVFKSSLSHSFQWAIVTGVITALIMPLFGAIVDHTPYRWQVGIKTCIILCVISIPITTLPTCVKLSSLEWPSTCAVIWRKALCGGGAWAIQLSFHVVHRFW